jgi:hypothetical protein
MLVRLLLAALLASPAPAEQAWPSTRGSGLLTLPDAATLAPGRAVLSMVVDNRDRDPLGLDLLDGSLLLTLGVAGKTEAYGWLVFSRVASLPEPPALPPPPLDLIVAPDAEAPPRPHYALYAETPYVDKRGSARFDAWVPGDALVGVKRRISQGRAWKPALAAALELKLPLDRGYSRLQSGSGTGGWDVGARLVASWDGERQSAVATAGYVRTGNGPLGDRLLVASDAAAHVSDRPLELADRLELGVGGRRALSGRLAILAEAFRVFEVGERTPILDAAPPFDLLAGVQLRLGRSGLTAGLRFHANALDSALRPSPLAGLVDLTDVEPDALAAYLQAVGAAGALPHLRDAGHRVIATRSGQPLPAGARRLDATYRIRSEHQVGFVLAWHWRF